MPLRLDPRHPPLWRTPTAVQFGADAVAVVEADQPWHTRLLAVLEEGLPAEHAVRVAGAMGAPAAEAVEFLAAIAPALRDDDAPAGEQVMLRVSGAVDPCVYAGVHEGLVAAGVRIVDHDHAPLIVVASHVLDPRVTARLMADDRRHLPIVATCSGAEVGPLVLPGKTACLTCVATVRTEREPWWPAVAAQLLGSPPPPSSPAIAGEAGLFAARLLTEAPHPPVAGTVSWTLRPDASPARRMHRPAERCGCRSPAGTATDPDLAPPAPRTATAFAVPA